MGNPNDLLQKIQFLYPKMSKGQKRIAHFILENYDKASYITAAKLGTVVDVSESTVVRFAYVLGYDGYPLLQKSLQELAQNKLTSSQRIALTSDMKEEDVLKSVFKTDMQNMRTTFETIDHQAFSQAVDYLSNARTIYVLGMRSSTPLAQFLFYYLNFLFEDVRLLGVSANDVYEQMIRIDRRDVFVGISFPRYSARTLEAMRFARQANAFTIAITGSINSPLAQHAESCLIAKSDMVSFADSLVAPLSLMNALIVALSHRNTESLTKRFDKLESIWDRQGIYTQEHGISHDNKNDE